MKKTPPVVSLLKRKEKRSYSERERESLCPRNEYERVSLLAKGKPLQSIEGASFRKRNSMNKKNDPNTGTLVLAQLAAGVMFA